MDSNTTVVKRATSQGSIRAHNILRVNEASREQIGKRISSIVEGCLEIDVRGIDSHKQQRSESLDSDLQRKQAQQYA